MQDWKMSQADFWELIVKVKSLAFPVHVKVTIGQRLSYFAFTFLINPTAKDQLERMGKSILKL